jgi:23S rRNA (uracil1939-C5)-methyltransferase
MPDFPFHIGELLEVEIEKLSFGGNGIARAQNVVIFVPYCAPGDLAQIKIISIKKRHAEGEIQKILRPSSARTSPPCPIFGVCGGCNWQHLQYQEQLAIKQQIVQEFLQDFLSSESRVLPIVASPTPFHYRNRAQLKFADGKLGFFQKGTHKVADMENCWILEEPLVKALPNLRKKLQKDSNPELVEVELSLLKDGSVDIHQRHEFTEGDGFSQVNRLQNEKLIQSVLQSLEQEEAPVIFDLYAGSGNFTFPILEKMQKSKTIGVELHPGAAQIAQKKLKQLHLSPKRAEFYNADVALFLRRFPVPAQSVVLLDPPRVGCSEEVVLALAALRPKRILYISCDPSALARDLQRFAKILGSKMRISQVQCFDMFPQTHHVETLVDLRIDS